MFKDPQEKYIFRVSRAGHPSIVLAAVDDKQYEFWHNAFCRARTVDEVPEYVSLTDSTIFSEDSEDPSYERPDDTLESITVCALTNISIKI